RTPADELLEEELAQSTLRGADRALATELFYGCLRQMGLLDYHIDQHVRKPPRPVVAWILRLGLYQLHHTDRIPAHAAVNESVRLAKAHATAAEAKFVNALLRQVV